MHWKNRKKFKKLISFFEKRFQMASSDFKWVPKHPPDLKTSFGSPHAPYEYIRKNFHKIDFWASKCIFQARGPSKIEKTHFQSRFRGFNFVNHFISWLTTLQGESIWPNEKFCRADFWLYNYFFKIVIFCSHILKNVTKS